MSNFIVSCDFWHLWVLLGVSPGSFGWLLFWGPRSFPSRGFCGICSVGVSLIVLCDNGSRPVCFVIGDSFLAYVIVNPLA